MPGNLGEGSRQHSAMTTWVWSICCLLLLGELIGDQVGASSQEGHSAIQMGLQASMLQAHTWQSEGRGGDMQRSGWFRYTLRWSWGVQGEGKLRDDPVLSS